MPPVATHQANDINCKVVAISDGDTFSCLTNKKKQIKVRVNQIDAPEKKQDFGTTAKNALADFIFNKTVRLETAGKDKYGRTLAEVYVNDNNINKAMVADGYAWAYREYMKDSEYANLESQARSNTLGLWSQPNPIYPSDFRHKKPTSVQTTQPVSRPLSQPVEPVQSIATPAAPSRGNHCGSKRYCKEMNDCAEAYFYLEQCGVSRLDRDSDGVPCESICN